MKFKCSKLIGLFVSSLLSLDCYSKVESTTSSFERSKQLSENSPLESLVPMLGGLVGVLLVIFFLAFIFKKFSNLNLSNSQINVLDCQRLGTKEKLVIVKVQDKHLLLGVTPQNISYLTDLDEPITERPVSLSFDKLMSQFLGKDKSQFNLRKNQKTSQSSSEVSHKEVRETQSDNGVV